MTAVREHPICFTCPEVRAILEGRKTQTRWPVKSAFYQGREGIFERFPNQKGGPFGDSGDRRLWVRETWRSAPGSIEVHYRADLDEPEAQGCWRPSIHMPRWASRLTLEVVNVRVGRLQDISEEDAATEGITMEDVIRGKVPSRRDAYLYLWDDLNFKRAPWADNPWVWVVEFKRIEVAK